MIGPGIPHPDLAKQAKQAKEFKQEEGIKYDEGKLRIAEMLEDFAEPLQELCKVWQFGADKYSKGNWKLVDNAEDRYTNAMLRHLMAEKLNYRDMESELPHAAHVAWNALARLYFIIYKTKQIQQPREKECENYKAYPKGTTYSNTGNKTKNNIENNIAFQIFKDTCIEDIKNAPIGTQLTLNLEYPKSDEE